jgi:hypothetical protein
MNMQRKWNKFEIGRIIPDNVFIFFFFFDNVFISIYKEYKLYDNKKIINLSIQKLKTILALPI